ncbi:uncharacterized protein LOC123025545 [Varanus komodoensis]|uniref:uncharacterized protein LOC123025545 n=1 Tax=Varanus komodoensis TaxID=61221 RepID=UPI001CF7E3C5|nr:uncharacterized protein LOC123025545 [Varanus komodoensis]
MALTETQDRAKVCLALQMRVPAALSARGSLHREPLSGRLLARPGPARPAAPRASRLLLRGNRPSERARGAARRGTAPSSRARPATASRPFGSQSEARLPRPRVAGPRAANRNAARLSRAAAGAAPSLSGRKVASPGSPPAPPPSSDPREAAVAKPSRQGPKVSRQGREGSPSKARRSPSKARRSPSKAAQPSRQGPGDTDVSELAAAAQNILSQHSGSASFFAPLFVRLAARQAPPRRAREARSARSSLRSL